MLEPRGRPPAETSSQGQSRIYIHIRGQIFSCMTALGVWEVKGRHVDYFPSQLERLLYWGWSYILSTYVDDSWEGKDEAALIKFRGQALGQAVVLVVHRRPCCVQDRGREERWGYVSFTSANHGWINHL
jgi:hypothetical protein